MGRRSWIILCDNVDHLRRFGAFASKHRDVWITGFFFINWREHYWICISSDGTPPFPKEFQVYLLDNVPHESNGKIVGATYLSPEESIGIPERDYANSCNTCFLRKHVWVICVTLSESSKI